MNININFDNKELLNKIINVLILLAVFVLLGIIVHKIFNSNVGVEKYHKGMQLFAQNDYQNAYYNFVRVPKNSKYYYLALFRQGMCAEKLGDNKTQAEKYEEFVNHSNNSLTAEAAFKSGLAYYFDKSYSDAEKMFKKAAKAPIGADEKFSNYTIAANYYLGELTKEKNPKSALNYYIEYLKNTDVARFSQKSAVEADKILSADNKLSLKEEEYFYLAKALFLAKDYQKAEKYFDLSQEVQAWILKAENYTKLGQKDKALALLNTGFENYSSELEAKDLTVAINNFANKNPSAIANIPEKKQKS